MSTQSLRELVEAIKGQGKTLASASGATAASARDLVYLSTSVERLFGADAILELIDSAARPVEHVEIELANVVTKTLTVDQVTKQVIRVTNISPTYTATGFEMVIPDRGVAFVVDNELPVPIDVKTSSQTTNIPQIAAGKVGWVFCDGNGAEFVVDVDSITSALTSPTQDPGDMIYRDGVPVNSFKEFNVYVRNAGDQAEFYFGNETRALAPARFDFERTPNYTLYPGVTYKFDTSDSSMDGHTLKFSATQDGTHNSGTELLDLNADSTNDITYVGTPGTSGAYTQVAIPAGTSAQTMYYYCGTHSGMGGTGVVTIQATSGVTKLPIGEGHQILTVDAYAERPVWRNPVDVFSASATHVAPSNEYTGLWADGNINLANHITDATNFPHAANMGTYDTQHEHTSAYRGQGAIFSHQGRTFPTLWGSDTEGRNAVGGVSSHSRSAGAISAVNGGQYGHQSSTDYENQYDCKLIVAGYSHSSYVDMAGQVWCCGHGDEGQNGDGANTDRPYWVKVNMPSNAGRCRYVVGTHSGAETSISMYALMENGDVYSWGYNGYGQLGHGDTTNRNVPTRITTLSNIRSIVAAGGNYGNAYAIDDSNNLFCWGYNNYGQVGNGSTTNVYTPVQVSVNNQPVLKVSASGYGSYGHTHCVVGNGRAYSWGYNGYGQLGDGSTTQRNSPTLVSTIGLATNQYVIDVWSVCGWEGASYYLTENGDMYAAGMNSRGILGVGDTTNKPSPTLMTDNCKWVSQISSSTTTTSTSYRYNSVMFMSHDNANDRKKRIKGTYRSTGYTDNALGKQNRPTNETDPRPTIHPMQGQLRWVWMGGYHTSSTLETMTFSIDEFGGMWVNGYNGDGAACGQVNSANPKLVMN